MPATTATIEYEAAGIGKKRLFRPSGVAIQPFVAIESPRHGDVVNDATGLVFSWRDSRAAKLDVNVYQISSGGTTFVADVSPYALSTLEKERKNVKLEFRLPFDFGAIRPVDGQRYIVELVVHTANDELSRTSIEVTYRK